MTEPRIMGRHSYSKAERRATVPDPATTYATAFGSIAPPPSQPDQPQPDPGSPEITPSEPRPFAPDEWRSELRAAL